MKSLNGKELMRGDCVLTAVGETVIAGNVHELYDRIGAVRIAGYPIPVKAADVILAKDAWDSFAPPNIAKRAAIAKAAADAEAAAKGQDALAGSNPTP